MEAYINFVCLYAPQAHWIIFGLLMLASLNLPISEDILIITAGALAATCVPEHFWKLFIWTYVGCWTSAWVVYSTGRLLGPKLYEIRWFSRFLTRERIAKLHGYYEKFGIFTFIIGRFIPGGVRNALFITSGLGKMPFLKFIARDGFACLISTSTLFYVGFLFGENFHSIIKQMQSYQFIALIVLGIAILIGIVYFWQRKHKPEIAT